MAGALYYPSWSLNDPISLGEFLLYWDRLTFLTPSDEWDFPVWHDDPSVERSLHEAHQKYALPHSPTEEEKRKCDDLIRRLFRDGVDDLEKYTALIGSTPYQINSRKLAYETVEFLEQQEVLKHIYGDTYRAGLAGGHLVMAVLALCCSSTGLPPVTTHDTQFKLQMLSLDDSLDPEGISHGSDVGSPGQAFSILIKGIKLPKARSRDPGFLKQVLLARQKDEVNGYRETFQATVRKYCERLMGATCDAEICDILADFDSAADADRRRLARELRAAGLKALTSKGGAVAVSTGALLGNMSPELGALGFAVLGWRVYRHARGDVLSRHWTSWLHQIAHPRFSIW